MTDPIRLVPAEELGLKARIGVATLTKQSFDGEDLHARWAELVAVLKADPENLDLMMDLSVVAELISQQELGLQIQTQALLPRPVYRPPCASQNPRLRVLVDIAHDRGQFVPEFRHHGVQLVAALELLQPLAMLLLLLHLGPDEEEVDDRHEGEHLEQEDVHAAAARAAGRGEQQEQKTRSHAPLPAL